MVSPEVLQRLQMARTPKDKKAPKPIARVSEKKKQEIAEGKGKTPRIQIAHRSEKMKGIMTAIKPLYRSFLKEKPICKIRSEVCTGKATCIHHTAGRGMERLMDMNSWEASCDPCNKYVEKHDQWARDNGHKISRHSKPSN